MKKIALLSGLVLALGFTSCDDFDFPNPPAQSNPQESILKTDEVSVKSVMQGAYNLEELNAAGTAIEVAQIDCTTLPDNYVFESNVEISANGGSYYAVASTTEKTEEGVYMVSVTPDDLEGVYRDNISKDPSQKQLNVRMSLATRTGNQVAYVGGIDNYYGAFDMTIIPFAPAQVIEDAYYLINSASNWDVSKALKMSNSGASPYDDPVFTVSIDSPANYEWKVIPASSFAAGNANNAYGVADSAEMEGSLVAGGNSGVIASASMYLVTINMEELTYSVSEAVPFLYTPGDTNGWSQTASQMLYTNDYANYYGYAYLGGGFKFTNAPDWDHTNYGSTGVAGQLSNDSGAGNLSASPTALYWCHVNTPALTYELTEITTIGLIGDATPGGWDASTALTPTDDQLTWIGDVKFNGTGEFKFRANNGWDINLGGQLQDLVQDGANLPTPGEGTYRVILQLGQLPYSVIISKLN